MLPDPRITVLCRDPLTTYRLNCNAFQQHALTSAFGWQYAAFYTSDVPKTLAPRYVSLARRSLPSGDWHRITFRDYSQITEDGHNTISIGISKGDGRIHIVWDLHCDELIYRTSEPGVAWGDRDWSESAFGSIKNSLPGAEKAFEGAKVTYPRFLSFQKGGMLFECRVGRAGSGDTVLCRYEHDGVLGWRWNWQGLYLKGEDCSPYINGLSFDGDRERLWVSWTNRRFVQQQLECDLSQKAQQEGPNGPENNEHLGCAWSDDEGMTWKVNDGNDRGGKREGTQTVWSRDHRAMVRTIPRNSGIMNSEAQCIGGNGDFHVLMRDSLNSGIIQWKHHWWDGLSTSWSTEDIVGFQPTSTGRRGKVFCDPHSRHVYFVLPGNSDLSLTILRKEYQGPSVIRGNPEQRSEYGPLEVLWQKEGFDGEPLVDEERLGLGDRVVSIMNRRAAQGHDSGAEVVVLDWDLGSTMHQA